MQVLRFNTSEELLFDGFIRKQFMSATRFAKKKKNSNVKNSFIILNQLHWFSFAIGFGGNVNTTKR